MRSRSAAGGLLALAVVLAGCAPDGPGAPDGGGPDAGTLPEVLLHSHNDYLQPRPLLDALDHRFDSVEADLYLQNGGLAVSHDGVDVRGTLDALYLAPLRERVQANGGSVYGDGRPFYLWLDLKEGSTGLQDAVATALEAEPMLTRFDDAGVAQPGAVTVILTGTDAAKVGLEARPAPRPYIRDSNDYAADDPPADGHWGYYAIEYYYRLAWDGTGQISDLDRRKLRLLVDQAHQKGRRLRIYDTPQTDAFWQAAREEGVDFLQTDDLAALQRFAGR